MEFTKALLLLVAIPLFGLLVSHWVLSDLNGELAASYGDGVIETLCDGEARVQADASLQQLCDEIGPILWMRTGSIVSGAVAVLLLLSFTVFSSIAGTHRARIAYIFPPLVQFTLITLAGLVVVQGAILTYGAYIAELHALNMAHFLLIVVVGGAALAAGLGLISAAFRLAKKQTLYIQGVELNSARHADIFVLVKAVAKSIGAKTPSHIIVGLEANFYVTSASISLEQEPETLTGETLYLSLPLARLLSVEELKGIIAHELAHFRGKDTYYSSRFAPVYAGLYQAFAAIADTQTKKSVASIATFPAVSVLSYMLHVFHANVSSVNRERELEADKAATEVVAPEVFASSLLKVGLYTGAWDDLEQKIIVRMEEGKLARNLSKIFESIVKYDVDKEAIPAVIDSIAAKTIVHPTDSHPPTASRIVALGLRVDEFKQGLLQVPGNASIGLFNNPCEIEERLTTLHQKYLYSLGVDVNDSNSHIQATVVAAFAASMLVADGKLEPGKLEKAESIGTFISTGFDFIELREFCLYPESIPPITELLDVSRDISEQAKSTIYTYLEEIANSSSSASPNERQLLNTVGTSFGLA